MGRRTLVDPRMLSRLSQFYPSRCTIQESAEVVVGVGTRQLTWTDVAGHVNLPAAIAPVSANETRAPAMTYSTETHHIALVGHYPSITSAMRAVVDGRTWDIQGVHDAFGLMVSEFDALAGVSVTLLDRLEAALAGGSLDLYTAKYGVLLMLGHLEAAQRQREAVRLLVAM